jgi:hypothetical protein
MPAGRLGGGMPFGGKGGNGMPRPTGGGGPPGIPNGGGGIPFLVRSEIQTVESLKYLEEYQGTEAESRQRQQEVAT